MSIATVERRYVRVPADWEDTVATRPALTREVTRVHGPGWQVEQVLPADGDTRAVVLAPTGQVNPRPGRVVETLARRTPDSVIPDFEARHQRAGLTTVAWSPADRECVAAQVPGGTVQVRNALARLLKAHPVDLEVTTGWAVGDDGVGHLNRVVVHRAPPLAATAAKRHEAWVEHMNTIAPPGPGDRWVVAEDTVAGTTVLAYRPDPLRGILYADELQSDVVGVPVSTIGRSERADNGQPDLTLDLARDATHIACQGQTRSGKSIFMYQLLSRLAASDSVIIAGADPSGILLAPFKGTRHAKWQALGTQRPEHVLDVLERVVKEMDERTASIVDEMTDKLEEFTPERPLIVVVMEELPGLLRSIQASDQAGGRSDVKLSSLVTLAFSRLLAEGAKVGIRVIVIAQRLDTTVLAGGDRANIPTRISFRVDKREAVEMLHESLPPGYDVEAVRRFPAGVGLVESSVTGLGVTRFRAPLLDGGYKEYARRVRAGSPVIDPTVDPDVVAKPNVVDLGELDLTLDDLELTLDDLEGPTDTDAASIAVEDLA